MIRKKVVLQAESSQSGLGAVLLQDGRPAEYASRSLSNSERKWAQVEKECLAILYGLQRFNQYTYGRPVVIEHDHKSYQTVVPNSLLMTLDYLQSDGESPI